MAIVNILNKTNITNATNATNPLHFQTIFGMSKHYFYLMKGELLKKYFLCYIFF